MKKVLRLAAIAAVAVMVASCGGNATTSTNSNSSSAVTKSADGTTSIDAILAGDDTLVGQTVVVEGICTHLCRHGARKMFLMGESTPLRIESGKLGSFKHESINSIVKVTGTVKEDRIDEAYLQNWERRLAASQKDTHGEDENGCSTERSARKEVGNTPEERIADFRKKIAARKAKEGKEYLSFYHIVADSYEIQ